MGFFDRITKVFRAPNASILVTLNKSAFMQGQEIVGTVLVTSSDEFEASELRIELEDIETTKAIYYEKVKVGDKEERVERTAEQTTTLFSGKFPILGSLNVIQGFREEYAFRIPISANSSITYYGRNASNKWTLKAVLGIRNRPDIVSHPIEVHIVPPVY